jgi:hypothetical protein
MPRRPTARSLESLHVTLQKLEQTSDAGQEDSSISELKQVVLSRIIDLELSKTFGATDDEVENELNVADLTPLPPLADSRPAEMGADEKPLEKFD